jgi:phosphoserine phosphatase
MPSMALRSDAPIQPRAVTAKETRDLSSVRSTLRNAKAVLFDVDSTLSPDEGIDELAGWLGKKAEVEALTSKAMNGDLAFEDAMRQRLQAMSPSLYDVQTMLSARPARITSGSQILISKLRRNGSEVFLVSGGFEQMVGQIADAVGVSRSHILANRLVFDQHTGEFSGHDESAFTARSGGKQYAAEYVRQQVGGGPVVMVGDGATDMEARTDGAADIFIGYGGVKRREKVEQEADHYVTDLWQLVKLIDK